MRMATLTAGGALLKAMAAPALDPAAALPVAATAVLLTALRRRVAWRSL